VHWRAKPEGEFNVPRATYTWGEMIGLSKEVQQKGRTYPLGAGEAEPPAIKCNQMHWVVRK